MFVGGKHQTADCRVGREPVERDTVYHRVHRDPDNFTQWESGESVDQAVVATN